MNTDFSCEKRLAKLNPAYHTLVKNAAFVLCHTLERYRRFFPDFTDHSILHSLQVLDFCNRLIGEQIVLLNEDELYVLLMSIYLHDCGMGISEDDYRELYDAVVSDAFRADDPQVETREIIRNFHQSFSKQLIFRYADLFEIPSPDHVTAIALVSEAHRRCDLFDEVRLPSVICLPNGNPIHLPYLASLIRLADELDIAADRNIGIGESGQDTIFKLMHRSILHLHILPDRFILDIKADDPALYDGIRREIGKLEDTLSLCREVIRKRTPFSLSQSRVEINRLPSSGRHITVLDTDLGTDDACALLLLTVLPKKPDYIVASHGNTTPEGALRNAVLLKKYLGLQSKIVRGLPPPDLSSEIKAEKNTFHGPDGLAGCREEMIKRLSLPEEDFKEVLSFSQFSEALCSADSVTYITIGTLTNLSFLADQASVASRFSGIYIMGGGIHEFNCSHETEFNFSKDPESVRKLLTSGMNITLFPLDVTNHQTLTAVDIDRLEAIGSYPEYITFLRHNLSANSAYNAIPAAVLHDALPVLYLSRPELFTLKDTRITVDRYGHTALSPRGEAMHLCIGVQDGSLLSAMESAFRGINLQSENQGADL